MCRYLLAEGKDLFFSNFKYIVTELELLHSEKTGQILEENIIWLCRQHLNMHIIFLSHFKRNVTWQVVPNDLFYTSNKQTLPLVDQLALSTTSVKNHHNLI